MGPPLPLDVGVQVLGHLGFLLDVPLVGLLDEASNVEFGGILNLFGYQLPLGLELSLLHVCVKTVDLYPSLRLLTNDMLQILDVAQQLAVGLDLVVVGVGHELLGVDDHIPRGCAVVEGCAVVGDLPVEVGCAMLVHTVI